MNDLFQPTNIGDLNLKNRTIRSATYESMAGESGLATAQLTDYMLELVRGEVGLIISGHAYVAKQGQAGPRQLAIDRDEVLAKLTEMVQQIHHHGGKFALQLAHAGRKAFLTDGSKALGPSSEENEGGINAEAMTKTEIEATVEAFAQAARRAQQAGCDAVQIHAAHGYLLSQFLSAHYNKRCDQYGGTILNRSRLLLEVYRAIRSTVGGDFPILLKINSEDFLENGLSRSEMLDVCRWLSDAGIDAVEISGGTFESGKFSPSRLGTAKKEEREIYYQQAAKEFRRELTTPLIVVGGFLSYQLAQNFVQENNADFIALSRPLISEPMLIKRWHSGDRSKAHCISCNRCFTTFRSEKHLHCPIKDPTQGSAPEQ